MIVLKLLVIDVYLNENFLFFFLKTKSFYRSSTLELVSVLHYKQKQCVSIVKTKTSYSLTERILEVPVLANECVLDELLISP